MLVTTQLPQIAHLYNWWGFAKSPVRPKCHIITQESYKECWGSPHSFHTKFEKHSALKNEKLSYSQSENTL